MFDFASLLVLPKVLSREDLNQNSLIPLNSFTRQTEVIIRSRAQED